MSDNAYIKAYENCMKELKKDFKTFKTCSGPKGGGSYYDYLAKIGQFYFTHEDFAQALVFGKHGFYAFSRNTALEYIKKYKKERYEHYRNCLFLKYREA